MRILTLATAFALAFALPAVSPAGGMPGVIAIAAQAEDSADDTDFLFRLGMLEGHLLIGHELLQAHRPALALPHFGHPIRELYDDVAVYLAAKKAPGFDGDLVKLEALATTAPDSAETEAEYQAVIAAVHRARDIAPAELRASLPEMIKICSDTIDAASGEFGESLEKGRVASVVEYHDSRGYLEFVARQVDDLKAAHPDAASQTLLGRFTAVLAKAQWIVGELLPDPTPRASVANYRAIASEASALTKP